MRFTLLLSREIHLLFITGSYLWINSTPWRHVLRLSHEQNPLTPIFPSSRKKTKILSLAGSLKRRSAPQWPSRLVTNPWMTTRIWFIHFNGNIYQQLQEFLHSHSWEGSLYKLFTVSYSIYTAVIPPAPSNGAQSIYKVDKYLLSVPLQKIYLVHSHTHKD